MAKDKRLPQAPEAEEAVIGSCLIDPDAIWKVANLQPQDFYKDALGTIWETMLSIAQDGKPLDFLTVCRGLEDGGHLDAVGGPAAITALINAVPTAIHVEHYADIVRDKAHRRQLIIAAGRIAQWAYDDEVEQPAARALEAILDTRTQEEKDLLLAEQVWPTYFELLERRSQAQVADVATGFIDLDLLLGGLRKGEMIVVAGRPGIGKSSLVETLADNVAGQGVRVLFASPETSIDELRDRRAARWSGIDVKRLRRGRDITAVRVAVQSRADEAIDYLDDPSLTTDRLLAHAYRIKATVGLGMIVVDYLQLLKDLPRKEDTARITYISGRLKKLAREFCVPLVAVSQLSRAVEMRSDKRPQLSDLRQSGALEQDADIVCLLYRERYYVPDCGHDVADIDVAKNRHGPTGEVQLLFIPQRYQFVNLQKASLPF